MERWVRSSSVVSLGVGVVAVAVLYLAKPVLLPLAVAVLLNVVFSPAVRRLERIGAGRLRIGRVGAVLVVAVLLAGVFAGMGWVVGRPRCRADGEAPRVPAGTRLPICASRSTRCAASNGPRARCAR